jgi:hypothetical protein
MGRSIFAATIAFERHQEGRRLARLAPGADAEVQIGFGQPEVREEDVRHGRVIVLTGVDDTLLDAARRERADHRCGLHEVGPRTDHVCYGSGHVPSYSWTAGTGARDG